MKLQMLHMEAFLVNLVLLLYKRSIQN